jgi:ABC-2 type transport system ATP-binding protein
MPLVIRRRLFSKLGREASARRQRPALIPLSSGTFSLWFDRPGGDMSLPPALEAHGLSKTYGTLRAVDSLDLEVPAGIVLGFLGPNGAGKTTAIRVLTTVLPPSAGTFAVAGIPQSRPAEIRRRVGALPESAGYAERQTGDEFIRYHARLFGHSRAGARAAARSLLEDVGLAERAHSLIGGYSRGMRQRLGLARALVNDPEVVFLDEPTLGLDPAGQRQVLELVRRIARGRGATVVLSTHLLDEVEEVCTRVVILNRGRIVADGTVAEVARRAAAPRQARLHVAAELSERAVAALGRAGNVAVAPVDGRPGDLQLTLAPEAGPEAGTAEALRLLLDAGVPVLGFKLEGGRLSDAFLEMTEPV